MEELLNHRIIDISAGDSHALALTHDSTVYAWGNNSVGQCGQVNVGQGSCRGGAVEGGGDDVLIQLKNREVCK